MHSNAQERSRALTFIVQMSGSGLCASQDLFHLLLLTAPPGRTSIFISMAKETDPENQTKLPIVTWLQSDEARIQM